jgi:hypothetical protein
VGTGRVPAFPMTGAGCRDRAWPDESWISSSGLWPDRSPGTWPASKPLIWRVHEAFKSPTLGDIVVSQGRLKARRGVLLPPRSRIGLTRGLPVGAQPHYQLAGAGQCVAEGSRSRTSALITLDDKRGGLNQDVASGQAAYLPAQAAAEG